MTAFELTQKLLNILDNDAYHLSYSARQNIIRQTLYRIRQNDVYEEQDIINHLLRQRKIQALDNELALEAVTNPENCLAKTSFQALFNFDNTFSLAYPVANQSDFDFLLIGETETFGKIEALDGNILSYTDGETAKKAYQVPLTRILSDFTFTNIDQKGCQILTDEINRFLMYNPLFIDDVFALSRRKKP